MSVESQRAQSAPGATTARRRGETWTTATGSATFRIGGAKNHGALSSTRVTMSSTRAASAAAARVVNPGASDAGAGLASRLNRKRRVARLTRSALHARLRAESARKALSLAKTRTARTPAHGPTRPREKRPTARSASAPALAPEPTARTARWGPRRRSSRGAGLIAGLIADAIARVRFSGVRSGGSSWLPPRRRGRHHRFRDGRMALDDATI